MFQSLKVLFLGILLVGACGPSPTQTATLSPTSNGNADPAPVESTSDETDAIPAPLTFIPRDASMVIRLDIGKLVQSFLWTDALGPQMEEFANSVEGCDSSMFHVLSDVVFAARQHPGSEDESDWEARFSTTRELTSLIPCLEAIVPSFNSFTIKRTNDGFLIHDTSGGQLAWVRWTDYGFRAGDGDITRIKGPANSLHDRIREIKTDSPFWFASVTDPALLAKPLENGDSRGHQMWFELRSENQRVAIRGGMQHADAETAKKQQSDLSDGILEGLKSKGVSIDLTELTSAAETRVEGRWILFDANWTHAQISQTLDKLQQAVGGTP